MLTRTLVPKHTIAIVLASLFLLCAALICTPSAYAEDDYIPSPSISSAIEESLEKIKAEIKLDILKDETRARDFYFAQDASGRCTITTVAMMVRRAAFLDCKSSWQDVTLASVAADGWVPEGVKGNFSTAGYNVNKIGVNPTSDDLIAMLKEHPEGVAIYDPSIPHALLLTDYDDSTDTFYCADPTSYIAGKRISVADSWNGQCRSNSQDAVIAGISAAWVIE